MSKFIKYLLIVPAVLLGMFAALAVGAWWWFMGVAAVPVPVLSGTLVAGSLQHQDIERSWQAYMPSGETRGLPILLVLHGSRGDGHSMMVATRYRFNELAESQRFIAVYPDGFEQHWNDCRTHAAYSANTRGIDDVGFMRAMVASLVREYGADPGRIYATGLSNGGHLAYRLGLEAPDLVAGIAAIAANMPEQANLDCVGRREPVATLIINGTEDAINPYRGGVVEVAGDSSRGVVLSATETARYWADIAGYEGEGDSVAWPDRVGNDGTTVRSEYWSRPGQVPVALVSVIGGGHTVPHPSHRLPRILGVTSHELDAASLVWTFFAGGDFPPVVP